MWGLIARRDDPFKPTAIPQSAKLSWCSHSCIADTTSIAIGMIALPMDLAIGQTFKSLAGLELQSFKCKSRSSDANTDL